MAFDPDAPVEVLDAPAPAKPSGKPVTFDPTAPIQPEMPVAEFHPNEAVQVEPSVTEVEDARIDAAKAGEGAMAPQGDVFGKGNPIENFKRGWSALLRQVKAGKSTTEVKGATPIIGSESAGTEGGLFTVPKAEGTGTMAGVVDAANRVSTGLTSPENVALLLGSGGVSALTKLAAASRTALAARIAQAGGLAAFTAQGGAATVDAIKEAHRTLADPKSTRAQKADAITTVMLSGGMTVAGAAGTVGEVKGAIKPVEAPIYAPEAMAKPMKTEGAVAPAVFKPEDVVEAAPAAAAPQPKTAPAEFLGIEGEGTSKQFTAYRLTEDIPGHVKGSSVDGKTLEAAGYKLPEMSAEESTIPPSAQKFDPTSPVQDVVPPEVLAEEQGVRVGVDDEDAIDAAAAKQAAPKATGFKTAKGSVYTINEDGTTTRNKAARPEHPGDAGPQEKSGVTGYVNREGLDSLSEITAQGGPRAQIAQAPDGRWGIKYLEGIDAGKFEKRTMTDVTSEPAVGLHPVELWSDGSVHFGNKITELTHNAEEPPAVLSAMMDRALENKGAAEGVFKPEQSDFLMSKGLTVEEANRMPAKAQARLQKEFEAKSISQPPESGAEKPVLSTIQSEPKQTSPVVEENTSAVLEQKNMPAWAREEMVRRGLDPKRPLNDVDTKNPSVISAVEADPTLSKTEKENVLETGSPRTSSAELKLNNADLGMPPVSGMSREARRAELEAAGIKTYKGKALEDLNPAELSNAVGKARRGILTPDGEKATSGVIAGSKAEEWADKVLKAKKGQLNAGIDPEQFTAYTVKGLANFERGVTDFAKWSKQMVKDFGDEIKPHLEKLFRATQELSSEGSRAAEATPEEIQAFLADYRNAPDAPATESTPVTRTQRVAKGLVTTGNKTLDLLTSGLAKESAPKTTALSEESGNALVRYASAAKAAPEIARSYAGQVLGSKIHDAAFANKLGAILVEDRLNGIRAGLLKQMEEAKKVGDAEEALEFKELADNVTTIIGKKGSPIPTMEAYKAALKDPEIAGAIERHKNLVMPLAEKQHADLGGRISKPGPDTGAFVNLEPLDEAGETVGGKKTGMTSKGDLTVPFKKGSAFSKRAYGSAEGYVTDYNEIVNRMLSGNLEETAKRQMYDQLTKDGLAVILPPGESPPELNGAPPRKIQIERRGLPGPGGGRTMIRNMYVDRNIYPEVMRAMNLDETFQGPAVTHLANMLNTLQIKGPVDGILHVANILTSIAGSPGAKSTVGDIIRRFPGVNVVDAIAKVTARSRDVVADSAEVRKQIAGLSQIGAGRAPHQGATGMTKLIQVVDKAARLARDDMFDNLVERGLAKDTEKNRREFVNQVGQYNARLMGQLSAKLKETGVSPFIVAGKTFNRLALRRLTATTGVEAPSTAANVKMRALEIGNLVTSLVVVPMVINYMISGKPMGRPGTPFGAIDTGHDNGDGKATYVDPQQWTGVRRGLRMTGLNAVASGIQHDEGGGRIFDSAVRDMIASYIHPAAGPFVNTAATLATGYNASGYRQATLAQPGKSQVAQNALAAVKQLNPFVGNAIKGIQNEDMDAKGIAVGTGMGAAKPFMDALGVKETSKISALQSIRTAAGKYNDQLGIQRDAAGRVSPYADLNKALLTENFEKAQNALQALIEQKAAAIPGRASETAKMAMAKRAVAEFYAREAREPFTGNLARERDFKMNLDADQAAAYEEAKTQRRQMAKTVRSLIYGR